MHRNQALLCLLFIVIVATAQSFDNSFYVNTTAPTSPFPHFWERCVGSGHASLALREDYRKQLVDSHKTLGWQYVRFHAIFDDDMSVVLAPGVYSFFSIDSVYDFLLDIGMRPIVELSFMPSILASGNETIFYYKGNITPPKNYSQWDDLVFQFVTHLIERYGLDEVSQWYFEVWNEPQCGFWTGTQADYFKLLYHTVTTIHGISRRLRVGGPATCQSGWIPETIAFAQQSGIELDFISTHEYPTDPFTESQRRNIMVEVMTATRVAAAPLPVLYTEYNSGLYDNYSNHDLPFAASYVVRFVKQVQGLVEMASYWTFSDIFEEQGMDAAPFHDGFGLNTVVGVPKPAYRAFQILHEAGDNEVPVVSQLGDTTQCDSWAVRDDSNLWVFVYNWDLLGEPMQTRSVSVVIPGVARTGKPHVTLRTIDDKNGNARPVWESMGKPTYPTASQVQQMKTASEVVTQSITYTVNHDGIEVPLTVSPYGVAVITVPLNFM